MADLIAVACKLPHGLVCEIIDMENYMAQADQAKAGRPVFVRSKGKFRLRGYNEARRLDSAGTTETESRNVIGLFGITMVERERWEEWHAQNRDYPAVKNGLIFAHAKGAEASARDYAKEHAKLSSGFDALDPMKPAKGIKPENFEGMTSGQKAEVERGMPAYGA